MYLSRAQGINFGVWVMIPDPMANWTGAPLQAVPIEAPHSGWTARQQGRPQRQIVHGRGCNGVGWRRAGATSREASSEPRAPTSRHREEQWNEPPGADGPCSRR